MKEIINIIRGAGTRAQKLEKLQKLFSEESNFEKMDSLTEIQKEVFIKYFRRRLNDETIGFDSSDRRTISTLRLKKRRLQDKQEQLNREFEEYEPIELLFDFVEDVPKLIKQIN